MRELTNQAIADRIARAMGWEKIGGIWQAKIIGEDGLYYTPYDGRVTRHPDKWSPATRWDHCFIGVEWMERVKGLPLEIIGVRRNRKSWTRVSFTYGDDGQSHLKPFDEPLTPRHISLAIIAALDDDSVVLLGSPKEES